MVRVRIFVSFLFLFLFYTPTFLRHIEIVLDFHVSYAARSDLKLLLLLLPVQNSCALPNRMREHHCSSKIVWVCKWILETFLEWMLTLFREWIYRSCIQGCVACPCERCVAFISWVIVEWRNKKEKKSSWDESLWGWSQKDHCRKRWWAFVL